MDIEEFEGLKFLQEMADTSIVYTLYMENGDQGKVIIPYRSLN